MHTTDTVDFDVILSGEVHLELDGGVEVRLQAGDCVIQNGLCSRIRGLRRPQSSANKGGAVEMPGLWKAWKAKGGLSALSTSPLEISPKAGEIPTFPQPRRSGLEKWKTKSRFSTFPPPLRDHDCGSFSQNRRRGAARRVRRNYRGRENGIDGRRRARRFRARNFPGQRRIADLQRPGLIYC